MCANLHRKIHLYCDDKEIELPYLEGATIINIPSQVGGVDYWGNHLLGKAEAVEQFTKQSTCDQILEVIGIRSVLHMGQCIIGLDGAIRLCQGKNIKLTVEPGNKVPMQIDGEPFSHQDGSVTVEVEFDTQIRMLKKVSNSANEIEMKCYQVVDWARQNGHITSDQSLLLEHELAKKFNS